jgi:hypothetical protein
MRFAMVLCLLAATLLIAGCEGGEENFMSCNLDPKVQELGMCAESAQGVTTIESCVVSNHPQCPHSICLSWGAAGPMCSSACSTDTDCPEAALCQAYGVEETRDGEVPGPRDCYCVPRNVVEESVVGTAISSGSCNPTDVVPETGSETAGDETAGDETAGDETAGDETAGDETPAEA